MTFSIHKNTHRARPLYWLCWFALLFKPKRIARRVYFDFSAKYDIGQADQADTNKLFGVAFGNVHRNSARFGWRYDLVRNKFILSAYCYLNGERVIEDLCEAVAAHYYDCILAFTESDYLFTVKKENGDILARTAISKGHKRKCGWLLGCYFGGNEKAPHNMTLQLKKI